MSELPTGMVSLLFSDIEGSTTLVQRLGDSWPLALDRHREICRAAWAAHDGIEMGTEGDSFFIVFASVSSAVSAAAEAQRGLAVASWPGGSVVRVRMGIHTGTPMRHGDGFVGLDVHLAARIAAAAHGGQVLVSGATAQQMERAAVSGVNTVDLGGHELKDIPGIQRIFQLVGAGLADEFPPPRTLGSAGNLPAPTTDMVGRDEELAAIVEILEAGSRLVTLTGPGGSGKTRLSIGVAAAVARRFPDGVFFVPLAAATTSADMWAEIAECIDGSADAQAPPAIFDVFTGRGLLLVLDNLEQLDGAASVVAQLLSHAPGVAIVATSRRPLHVPGEVEHPVPPLSLAESDDLASVAASGAGRMFVEHAQRVRADFELTHDNARDVIELCRALDGLPLALELVAARTKMLSPKALLDRVDRALDLGAGIDARPSRQRTLRAAIAWSVDLLQPSVQELLSYLALFAGGATLDALEAVAPVDIQEGGDLVEMLFELVDASLVTVSEGRDGQSRFNTLATIRRFALDQLADRGGLEAARIRQAQYLYDRASDLLELREVKGEAAQARASVLADLENFRDVATRDVRTVHDRSDVDVPVPATRVCALIVEVVLDVDRFQDAVDWTRLAVGARSSDDDWGYAECLRNLAHAHIYLGQVAEAEQRVDDCIAATSQLVESGNIPAWFDPMKNLSMSHTIRGHLRRFEGRYDAARAEADWGPALSELAPIRQNEVLGLLMQIESNARDFGKAAEYLDQKMQLNALRHDDVATAMDLANLCFFELASGRRETARTRLVDLVDAAIAADDTMSFLDAADTVALVLGPEQPVRAARLVGACQAERVATGVLRDSTWQADLDEHLNAVRALVADEVWDSAMATGSTESVVNLVGAALVEAGLGPN